MPVGDLHDQRVLPVQLNVINGILAESDELFGHQYDADILHFGNTIQLLTDFVRLVDHDALDPCQTHSHAGIVVVADYKHSHRISPLSGIKHG